MSDRGLEEKRLEIDRLTKQLDHMEQELLEKFCDVGKFVLEKIEKENREIDQLVDQVIEVKKELSRVKGEIRCPADVDFMTIARATSGASGAELANRINEAALRAVRMGRETVSQADLEESVETVIAGYQRKNAVLSEKERRIVSYHEIGHALVAAKQSNSAPVTKITIVPRTSGVLGYTMQVDEGEHYLMSKEEIENKIESEKMIFLLYFAVNAQQRSKGYGSQIIHELKLHSCLSYVTLPEGVTEVKRSAFEQLPHLYHVQFPSTLKNIEEKAFFMSYHQKQLFLPEGLTSIGAEAFAYSSISGVLTLPEGLKTIAEGAFSNNLLLDELYLPSTLESIGEHAFAGDSLSYIYMSGLTPPEITATTFESSSDFDVDFFSGCTGLTKVTVLCDASLLPENAFADCPKLKEATIASGKIPAGMFANSGLTEISIGEGVTVIGARAFYGTGLTSVKLKGITEIGSEAFADAALTEIQLGEDAITIGQSAFTVNPLQLLVIPANQPVDTTSFAGISNDVLRISDTASDEQVQVWSGALEFPWYDRLLRTGEKSDFIKMPYQSSPEDDFEFDPETGTIIRYHGSDVDVVVPRTIQGIEVQVIGYNAFDLARDYTNTDTQTNQTEWLKLRSLILPETVTSIEDSAFVRSGIEKIFVNSQTEGYCDFSLCSTLKELHVRNGVETFTLSAIVDDPSLELLCFEMYDAAPLEYSITEQVKPNLKLVIPEDTTEEQAAEYYLRFGPTMEGIIGEESQILREACKEPENPMPDIQSLLATYGIQ